MRAGGGWGPDESHNAGRSDEGNRMAHRSGACTGLARSHRHAHRCGRPGGGGARGGGSCHLPGSAVHGGTANRTGRRRRGHRDRCHRFRRDDRPHRHRRRRRSGFAVLQCDDWARLLVRRRHPGFAREGRQRPRDAPGEHHGRHRPSVVRRGSRPNARARPRHRSRCRPAQHQSRRHRRGGRRHPGDRRHRLGRRPEGERGDRCRHTQSVVRHQLVESSLDRSSRTGRRTGLAGRNRRRCLGRQRRGLRSESERSRLLAPGDCRRSVATRRRRD